MARRKSKTLTELELEIMNIVWKQGEVVVEDVHRALAGAGAPLAFPSIRTMLGILRDKGFLSRRPAGRGFSYTAKVARDQAQKSIVQDIVERAFDGSALSLVAALIDRRIVSRKELGEVKDLIRKQEQGGRS